MAKYGRTPTSGIRRRYLFTMSGGETSISGADDNGHTLRYHDGNYMDLMLNGVMLVWKEGYTTPDGETINLTEAATADDKLNVFVYDAFAIADHYDKQEVADLFVPSDPEHATDSGTDAFVSATNTTPPSDGKKITRDFITANSGSTPTLDGKTMTTKDGSALWAGAVSGVHDVQYDSGADTYLVLEPIGRVPSANGGPLGPRNGLINGDFRINQRGVSTGSALSLSDGEYFFDRWRSLGATTGIEVSTAGVVTLGASEGIEQVIEGRGSDSIGWAQTGEQVTVSVADPSADLAVTLLDYSETDSNNGTISSGSGRQSVTLTVPSLDSDGHLIVRIEDASAGGATFSDAQIEHGPIATPFERRLPETELSLCRRYYEKSYDAGDSPGTATTSGAEFGIGNANGTNTDRAQHRATFKTTKRSTPSVTVYSVSTGASGNVRDMKVGVDRSASADLIGDTGFRVYGFILSVDGRYGFQYQADAEL